MYDLESIEEAMNVERVRADRLEKIGHLVSAEAKEYSSRGRGKECHCACDDAVEIDVRNSKLEADCCYRPRPSTKTQSIDPAGIVPHCGTPEPLETKPVPSEPEPVVKQIKKYPPKDEVTEKKRIDPDFNADGAVNLDDVYSYLKSYVAKQKEVDVNRDGDINCRDFFAFAKAFCKASEKPDTPAVRKAWGRVMNA
jgi:hypothetical protein